MNETKSSFERPKDSKIVVASHPRSGTHLVIDLLRRQFPGCEPPRRDTLFGYAPYWNLDELVSSASRAVDRDIERMRQTRRPVLKTHRRPDYFANCQYTNAVIPERKVLAESVMADAATIFVYRNVVDVMKSLYAMVDQERKAPFNQFIREVRGPLSRIGWWARHLVEWRGARRTLLLSYEDLVRNPSGELKRIAAFIDEEPIMRSPILPGKPSSIYVERIKRFLPIHRETTALGVRSSSSEKIPLTSDDVTFIRNEVGRIDPALEFELSPQSNSTG